MEKYLQDTGKKKAYYVKENIRSGGDWEQKQTGKFSCGVKLYNCLVVSEFPTEEAMWAVAVFLWSLHCNYGVIV